MFLTKAWFHRIYILCSLWIVFAVYNLIKRPDLHGISWLILFFASIGIALRSHFQYEMHQHPHHKYTGGM